MDVVIFDFLHPDGRLVSLEDAVLGEEGKQQIKTPHLAVLKCLPGGPTKRDVYRGGLCAKLPLAHRTSDCGSALPSTPNDIRPVSRRAEDDTSRRVALRRPYSHELGSEHVVEPTVIRGLGITARGTPARFTSTGP